MTMMYYTQMIKYFDIVTFDCFDKLPFILKQKHVAQLMRKGIYIEINYSDAL